MDRYALVIGIGHYDGMDDLSKPSGDAIALQKVLERAGWRVTCLSDRVSYETLESALKVFLERQTAGQDALIYFTGHGFMVEESEDDRRGYLATSDCTLEFEGKAIVSQRRGLSFSRLNGLIGRAQLSSLVVLLDCCHGGLFVEDGLVKQSFQAAPDQNFCWIAACRSFQQSYARKSQPHSLFTGALLASLGLDHAGDVTVLSVLRDVNAAFRQMALQEPIYIGAGKDIPLIRHQPPIAPTISEENPYQGLLAFTAETKQFFFGRETEIQTLVQKVQRCGFVPLIGASGSGKSSVVRAGLMPRLQELGWRVLEPMKPGTEPQETLRSRLADLSGGEVEPGMGVKPRIPADERILLVVDQFEEVFTLGRDRTAQSQFIQALMAESDRMVVVVTLRADFVEACLTHQKLTEAIQADAVWLGAMAREHLELAIEQPAIAQGATLQPKLLAQILQDVESEENCLPLLEFALMQLWERKSEQTLTLDAYRQLGGVAGALNAHAEAVYKQLATQKREEWVQRVMLRLVRTGEGTKDTRQRQRKADLLTLAKDEVEREAIAAVLQTLVDGRLLVSDRVDNQDVIDLSHEALMQSWQRLAGWRESDREVRRIVDKIEDARREWQDNRKQRRYLLDGRLLKDAKRLLKEESAVVISSKAFIQKSLWRRRMQMVGVLVIPLLTLGVPAEYFWREETVKRDYERIARLSNFDPGERAAVLGLVSGCWAEKRFARPVPYGSSGEPNHPNKLGYRVNDVGDYIDYYVGTYIRERIFGNCRSLQNANLKKADLENVDLSYAKLRRADLSYANLSDASLSGADLDNVNLSGVVLRYTDLRGAKLVYVNWGGANLRRADLSGAFIFDPKWSGADLRGAHLNGAKFASGDLSGADLRSANLENTSFVCGIHDKYTERKRVTCPTLKNIKWDKSTNWKGSQGWETVENIPPALQRQLGLKGKKEEGREKTEKANKASKQQGK
jgi:Caspase domain/Pentapeptide repeats (8 copies)